MLDEPIPKQPGEPSHLITEQGLFSRSNPATAPVSGTTPVTASDEEDLETDETEPETMGEKLKNNLFWIILIPMVLIEIALLVMVIMQ